MLLKVQSTCMNALGFVEFTSEVHELFAPVVLVVLVVLGLEPVALHILSKGSIELYFLQPQQVFVRKRLSQGQ